MKLKRSSRNSLRFSSSSSSYNWKKKEKNQLLMSSTFSPKKIKNMFDQGYSRWGSLWVSWILGLFSIMANTDEDNEFLKDNPWVTLSTVSVSHSSYWSAAQITWYTHLQHKDKQCHAGARTISGKCFLALNSFFTSGRLREVCFCQL